MTRQHLTALLAVTAIFALPTIVRAGMIEISMAGTSLTYSDPDGSGAGTGTLTNSGGATDSLSSLTTTEDGGTLGVLVNPPTPLAFDLDVSGIPSITLPPANGSTSVTAPAGGSFELFVDGSTALELDLDSVEVVYTRLSISSFDIRVLFAGTVGEIAQQDLPFDVKVAEPVTLTFNLQQGTSTDDGTHLISYVGNGTGVISSVRVPEPSTMLLAGSCLAGLALIRRRMQS
ncbi:PEP-CTERM sorting domain-containing protein [Aeoliella sp.]|uniref:PEP-CTERM sorting domain-containing protein n=1 Tax=Aeoliella sp. TaxID=2795800 RepID=UPI003CCBFCE3